MSSFSLDVRKIAEEKKVEIGQIKRSVVFALFRDVIKMSPVDKGRFKGNWFITENTPSISSRIATDKTPMGGVGPVSTAELEGVTTKFTVDILTNNLVYGPLLEFGGYATPVKKGTWNKKTRRFEIRTNGSGYSRQAPFGMIRVTLRRFNKIAKEKGWA